jgi:hypothetical protein
MFETKADKFSQVLAILLCGNVASAKGCPGAVSKTTVRKPKDSCQTADF